MNFVFFIYNRKDCSESIVQSISFHNKLSLGNPVQKDGSKGECLFERVESITTGRIKLPENILLDEMCQINDNV